MKRILILLGVLALQTGCKKDTPKQAAENPQPVPMPNTSSTFSYSWDNSWQPVFPLNGMYDEFYFDGHLANGTTTPVLPPGNWDYGSDHNLANYRNFTTNIGHWETRSDPKGNLFGWRLVIDKAPADIASNGTFFHGTPGADIYDAGAGSLLHSTGNILLGAGPDVLRFERSYALDLHTGPAGSASDNDLVMLGKAEANTDGSTDTKTTTVHLGPGADLAFVNNMEAAAIDAGNKGGRTDAIDAADENDRVMFGGNMRDFRFYGGKGDDLAVWYVDQVKQKAAGWIWLGPNFFGGGGWGSALWEDNGNDRLVLAVPDGTAVTNAYGAPKPGNVHVYQLANYLEQPGVDAPTENDPLARYCITCGTGPANKRTITLEYASADGSVFTGRFWLTAFEELQIGVGAQAKVYRLDQAAGKAILDTSLKPSIVPSRKQYADLITEQVKGSSTPVPRK